MKFFVFQVWSFRVSLSFPDRHEIVTKKLTWTELCQNAVLNKIIDIIRDNDTLVFRDLWACHWTCNIRNLRCGILQIISLRMKFFMFEFK